MPDRDEGHAADVVVGRDGFLFHRLYRAFEQLCGDSVPADRELAHWVSTLETNFAWCAAKRVRYLAVIVPERHVIYADKLPADYAISSARAVIRLLGSIDPAMRDGVAYPETALRAARAGRDVFFKTDEHLSLPGTCVLYRAILDHLQPGLALSPLNEHPLQVKRRRASGNLGMRLDEEPLEDLESWLPGAHGGARRIFRNRGGEGRVEVFQHDDGGRPRAILFGDSHLDEIRHLLVTHFSRTVIVHHCQRLFFDLVRSERPDLVLHLLSETQLAAFQDLASALTGDFPRYCGEPLPAGRAVVAIDFGSDGNSEGYVREGWSYPEQGHTWMTGTHSTLVLPRADADAIARAGGEVVLDVSLSPLIRRPERPRQRLTIGYRAGTDAVTLAQLAIEHDTTLRIPFPNDRFPPGRDACLTFDHPDAFALTAFGQSEGRVLSFAVIRLNVLVEAAAPPLHNRPSRPS